MLNIEQLKSTRFRESIHDTEAAEKHLIGIFDLRMQVAFTRLHDFGATSQAQSW